MKKKIWYGGLALLFTGIAAAAVFCREENLTYAYLPVHASWLVILFGCLVLLLFFFTWLNRQRKKWDPAALPVSVLFSFFFTISSMVSANPAMLNSFSDASVILRFLGILPFFYAAVSWVYGYMDIRLNRQRNQRTLREKKHTWILFTGVLMIAWTPVFVLCYPGNMTVDTGTSILQYYGVVEHLNNPWLLTALCGIVISAGDLIGNANLTLFLFCFIQAFLFAVCLSKLLEAAWEAGAPSLLLGLILLCCGIFPSVSSYVFCMGKDSSFALGLLWIAAEWVQFQRGGQNASFRNRIGLLLSLVYTPLTRNGFWVVILILLVALLIRIHGRKTLFAATAALVLMTSVGIPKLFNESSSITENLSIPLQQTARTLVLYEKEMSKEEKAQYKSIMALKYWGKYKTGISDPVKKRFQARPTPEYLQAFFDLWRDEGQRHPRTYLGAAVLMNYGYYVPLADRSDIKSKLFLGIHDSKSEDLEKHTTLRSSGKSGQDRIRNYMTALDHIPIIRLLTRIGIYSWLLIAVLVYCISRKKPTTGWALLLLPMSVLIGCCFSPVNGYYRYAFPMIITTPVFSLIALYAEHENSERRAALSA